MVFRDLGKGSEKFKFYHRFCKTIGCDCYYKSTSKLSKKCPFCSKIRGLSKTDKRRMIVDKGNRKFSEL